MSAFSLRIILRHTYNRRSWRSAAVLSTVGGVRTLTPVRNHLRGQNTHDEAEINFVQNSELSLANGGLDKRVPLAIPLNAQCCPRVEWRVTSVNDFRVCLNRQPPISDRVDCTSRCGKV